MKISLKRPITLVEGGVTVTELVFREDVVSGDTRGLKVSDLADPKTEDILKIAGRLCGQPDVVMSHLGFLDQLEVTKLVMGFLTAGQATGPEQSP